MLHNQNINVDSAIVLANLKNTKSFVRKLKKTLSRMGNRDLIFYNKIPGLTSALTNAVKEILKEFNARPNCDIIEVVYSKIPNQLYHCFKISKEISFEATTYTLATLDEFIYLTTIEHLRHKRDSLYKKISIILAYKPFRILKKESKITQNKKKEFQSKFTKLMFEEFTDELYRVHLNIKFTRDILRLNKYFFSPYIGDDLYGIEELMVKYKNLCDYFSITDKLIQLEKDYYHLVLLTNISRWNYGVTDTAFLQEDSICKYVDYYLFESVESRFYHGGSDMSLTYSALRDKRNDFYLKNGKYIIYKVDYSLISEGGIILYQNNNRYTLIFEDDGIFLCNSNSETFTYHELFSISEHWLECKPVCLLNVDSEHVSTKYHSLILNRENALHLSFTNIHNKLIYALKIFQDRILYECHLSHKRKTVYFDSSHFNS